MHIEPGLVDGAKIVLSYATAAGAGAYALGAARKHVRERGAASLFLGTALTTALVFGFFEVFPHYPVGVSEVHLILGSTLFLLFGAAPAAVGLALGLLIQGLLVAPFDLPQYGMNVTTLLVPLFALRYMAGKTIAPDTRYVDLKYRQALALSATYQAGIVSWVTFWALYGQGFSLETFTGVATFAVAYMLVVVLEPVADLAVLAAAKAAQRFRDGAWLEPRLFDPA
ncbi:energy-coupling factor ABC transporter permease [Mycolicibacterium sp. BiH015]|uniref:energy-coupling factor ABC transporter permease n=1 Tax=Mycolicibacterium sp. BiH015 TaxID=3018808 RepID=UPI0022E2BCCC|nr:energy-coupling factor ABC transporter permease [Mycolicibacterium sp. BiH015]MDA2892082.1 energy-coupling factor ABC transporter permease [Mycolicibacterium sp. BiH015]